MIAELDVSGGFSRRVDRLELIADAFFSRLVSEDTEARISVFSRCDITVFEKGNGVAVNGDARYVRLVSCGVISLIFGFSAALWANTGSRVPSKR